MRIAGQRLARCLDETTCGRRDGVLERPDEAGRPALADLDDDGVGQGVVGEGVLLAGWHRHDEPADERGGGVGGEINVSQVVLEGRDSHRGEPVEGLGGELDGSDHADSGVVLIELVVVDGGEVIGLDLDGVGAQRVGDLHGRVDVEVFGIGDHATEQRDLDPMIGIGGLLGVGTGDLALRGRRELRQAIELLVGVEDEVLGALDALVARAVLYSRFVGLETERLDDREGLLSSILLRQSVGIGGEAVHEQFDDAQCPRAGLGSGQEVLEGRSHGLLPCL